MKKVSPTHSYKVPFCSLYCPLSERLEQAELIKANLIANFFLQVACVTVAALMQYFFMAALCWMLVEGICLYLFVVKVYNFNHKMSVYHGMSWGKDNERCIESRLR